MQAISLSWLLKYAILVRQVTAGIDFLHRYETFTPHLVEEKVANHVKRSMYTESHRLEEEQPVYRFAFDKFGVHFSIILTKSSDVADNAVLSIYESSGRYEEKPLKTNDRHTGYLEGDETAIVSGRILANNVFNGIIHSPKLNNTYFLEPTSMYPQLVTDNSQLIYRYTDLDFSKYPKLARKNDGVHPPEYIIAARQKGRLPKKNQRKPQQKRHVDGNGWPTGHRVQQTMLPSMHCPLHVFIDHRFFEQLGQSNIAGTIETVVDHLDKADVIFRSTKFNGQVSNNIGFIIARITLFKDEQANPMSHVQDGEEAQVFLNAFTAIDHSKYCLGVMFTVVDFSEGVLGLAWIASENSLDAGICSTPYRFRNGSTLSFNSAIVSARNYGNVIPTPMFTITLVHELGHNFGAEHDNKSRYSCAPDGDDGNYIMYELSGDGSHPNHFVFSTCSTNLMYRVLLGRMPVCFQERYIAICGNFRIDPDTEECDCGTEATCSSIDSCCSVFASNSSNQCKLKSTSKCSAVASRCCSPETCDFTPASEAEMCSLNSDCNEKAYCNGLSATCPTPASLPDGTLCNQNLMVCINGKCSENVCTYHGYKSCYCTGSENDCLVCCRHNTTGECKPAALWGFNAGIEGAIPTNGICIDESGRCDENGLCRFPNGSYAKDDIIRLVKESAKDFIVLLSEYWYYALLSLAGFCGLVALFTFIHRSTKPVQSMAYKDGRMAYVWFEARSRLASIEAELEALEKYVPPTSLPYPIAIRRIAYQFPTAPHSLYSRYMVQCEREREVVKLLLLKGYPMRKLLTDENDERHEQKAIDKTLAHKK